MHDDSNINQLICNNNGDDQLTPSADDSQLPTTLSSLPLVRAFLEGKNDGIRFSSLLGRRRSSKHRTVRNGTSKHGSLKDGRSEDDLEEDGSPKNESFTNSRGRYIQMEWFGLLNDLNYHSICSIPHPLLFENRRGHLKFGSELSWSVWGDGFKFDEEDLSRNVDTANKSGVRLELGSAVRLGHESGVRLGHESGVRLEHGSEDRSESEDAKMTAFASGRLGLYGKHKENSTDCIAIGTSTANICLYRRVFKQRNKKVESFSIRTSNGYYWRRCLEIQLPNDINHDPGPAPDSLTPDPPTALSFLPPFPSLPSSVDGILLCGTAKGSLYLWMLVNLSPPPLPSTHPLRPSAILSTIVAPPSPHSQITALSLVSPSEVLNPPPSSPCTPIITPTTTTPITPNDSASISPSLSPESVEATSRNEVILNPVSATASIPIPTALAAWSSGDVFLLRFVLSNQLKSICQRRRLWAPDPLLGQIYRITTHKLPAPRGDGPKNDGGPNRLVVVLSCTRGVICLQVLPDLKVLFRRTEGTDDEAGATKFNNCFAGIIDTVSSLSFRLLDLLNIDAGAVAMLETERVVLLHVPDDGTSPYIIGHIRRDNPPQQILGQSQQILGQSQQIFRQQFWGHFDCSNQETKEPTLVIIMADGPFSAICLTPTHPDIFVSRWLDDLDSDEQKERDIGQPKWDIGHVKWDMGHIKWDMGEMCSIDLIDLMLALLSHAAVFSVAASGQQLRQKKDQLGHPPDAQRSWISLAVELCQRVFKKLLDLSESTSLQRISKILRRMNRYYLDELPRGTSSQLSPHFPDVKNYPSSSIYPLIQSSLIALLLNTACLASIELMYLISPDDWIAFAPEALPTITARLTSLTFSMSHPNRSSFSQDDHEIDLPLVSQTTETTVPNLSQILMQFRSDSAYAVLNALEQTSSTLKLSPKTAQTIRTTQPEEFHDQQFKWFKFIQPLLFGAQEDGQQAARESINRAIDVYRYDLSGGRVLLFEILNSLWMIGQYRKDTTMAVCLTKCFIGRMKELVDIDGQQASRLFRVGCLKPIGKSLLRESKLPVRQESEGAPRNEQLPTPEDAIRLNESVSTVFELSDIICLALSRLGDWQEEMLLLDELVCFRMSSEFDSRTSMFVKRFTELSCKWKTDDEFYSFVQRHINNIQIVQICLSTLLTIPTYPPTIESPVSSITIPTSGSSELFELAKQYRTPDRAPDPAPDPTPVSTLSLSVEQPPFKSGMICLPRSTLLLYSALGRLQEGQEEMKRCIIAALKEWSLSATDSAAPDLVNNILCQSIRAVCESQSASILSQPPITQFWVRFLFELHNTTILDGPAGSGAWFRLSEEIINWGAGAKPCISSLAMMNVILHLLGKVKSNIGTVLPSSVECHIQKSQQLLCRLACRVAAEERLFGVAVECFESALMATLSKKLEGEKNGVAAGEFQQQSTPDNLTDTLCTPTSDKPQAILMGFSNSTLFPFVRPTVMSHGGSQSPKMSKQSESSEKLNNELFMTRYLDEECTEVLSNGIQLDKDGSEFDAILMHH